MKELEEFIMNELPSNGEWWTDGHQAFTELAQLLKDAGVPNKIIIQHLQAVYSAVADEFGE
jgi:hypothetical protein